LLAILSYVADVPFEKVDSVTGEKERGRTSSKGWLCFVVFVFNS